MYHDPENNLNFGLFPTIVHYINAFVKPHCRAPSPSESALSASEAFEDARSEPDETIGKEYRATDNADNAIRKEFFEAENDFIYQR